MLLPSLAGMRLGRSLSRDTMFRAKLRHQVSRIHNLLIILLINISIK